jgi:succinyl-CoA synthetase beta subunit
MDMPAIHAAVRALGDAPVSGRPALEIVAALGIPVARSLVVACADDAVAGARELGFPVVLKVADPQQLHKTEMGGVIVGIRDETALRAAVDRLCGNAVPALLVLQPHHEATIELIIGLERRPGLGSFVLVGMGGIWTEVLDDVSIRPAGLLADEALEMIRGLRAWPVLNGVRARQPVALTQVVDAVQRLDRAALELGGLLRSLDINPLLVGPEGVVAVDALVSPGAASPI